MPKALRPQRPDSQAGFSLIEAMIAAVLLLIVILGVLPLVTRGVMNNLQGNDASNEANATVDGIERLVALPWDNIALQLVPGKTSLPSTDFFALGANSWGSTVPSGDRAQYIRNVQVEWFGANDLEFDDSLDTPLDGGVGGGGVQIKRITLQMQNARRYFRGPSTYRVIALQTY